MATYRRDRGERKAPLRPPPVPPAGENGPGHSEEQAPPDPARPACPLPAGAPGGLLPGRPRTPISSSSPGTSSISARSRSSAPRTASGRRSRATSPCRDSATSSSATSRRRAATGPAPALGQGRQRPEGLPLRAAHHGRPRTPFALLERNGLFLADEEGAGPRAGLFTRGIPACSVISDETGFASNFTSRNGRRPAAASRPCPRRADRPPASAAATSGRSNFRFKGRPGLRVIVGRESPVGNS